MSVRTDNVGIGTKSVLEIDLHRGVLREGDAGHYHQSKQKTSGRAPLVGQYILKYDVGGNSRGCYNYHHLLRVSDVEMYMWLAVLELRVVLNRRLPPSSRHHQSGV
jgi:hypothetical protein